jgi:hypothetical protein
MSDPITPSELVDRVEALHDEIKTLRASVRGTGSGPNSNELHDFLSDRCTEQRRSAATAGESPHGEASGGRTPRRQSNRRSAGSKGNPSQRSA